MADEPPPVEDPVEDPTNTIISPNNGWVTNAPFTTISMKDNDSVDEEPFCRICHDTGAKRGQRRLVQPCLCSGTLGNVHKACIERWLTITKSDRCSICDFQFKTKLVIKPVRQWIWPPMTTENIVVTVVSILIHVTVFIQLFCLLYICFQLLQDDYPSVLGVAVAGLVTGMPWTLFIAFAMDFNICYSDYWKAWKTTNQRVKLIVDDLKFYHNVNTLH